MAERSILNDLMTIVDDRCGLVGRIYRFRFPAGFERQMHGFTAFLGRTAALHPGVSGVEHDIGMVTGSGTAVDEDTAQIRALC